MLIGKGKHFSTILDKISCKKNLKICSLKMPYFINLKCYEMHLFRLARLKPLPNRYTSPAHPLMLEVDRWRGAQFHVSTLSWRRGGWFYRKVGFFWFFLATILSKIVDHFNHLPCDTTALSGELQQKNTEVIFKILFQTAIIKIFIKIYAEIYHVKSSLKAMSMLKPQKNPVLSAPLTQIFHFW